MRLTRYSGRKIGALLFWAMAVAMLVCAFLRDVGGEPMLAVRDLQLAILAVLVATRGRD